MKNAYGKSLPRQWRDIADVFTALGDPQRQRILLLFERGERLNVGQIASASSLARSTVSHHLKTLRLANVLLCEKQGKEIYFWINRSTLEKVLANVLDYVRENT